MTNLSLRAAATPPAPPPEPARTSTAAHAGDWARVAAIGLPPRRCGVPQGRAELATRPNAPRCQTCILQCILRRQQVYETGEVRDTLY